ISGDGTLIATGDRSGKLILWDSVGRPRNSNSAHEDLIRAMEFSTDGSRLATAGEDGTIKIWSNKLQLLKTLVSAHALPVHSIAFDSKGFHLIAGSEDGSGRIWNLTGNSEDSIPLIGHTNIVSTAAFSPDDKIAATGGRDGTIRLWDAATGLQRLVIR